VRPGDTALVERLSSARRAVEIGVGEHPDVAVALARRGVEVTATDIRQRAVPDPVAFVRDDVTDPDPSVYADADLLYARNLPPELHRPARDLARRIDARFRFTTLGGDPPVVPVDREQLAGGVTLFTARDGPRSEP